MPNGSSPQREKEYEDLKEKFEQSGRYGDRAAEVAARIVNKQRAEFGETKDEQADEKAGKSPDRNLPVDNYTHLTVPQLESKLDDLSKADLNKVKHFEEQHKHRKGALDAIASELKDK